MTLPCLARTQSVKEKKTANAVLETWVHASRSRTIWVSPPPNASWTARLRAGASTESTSPSIRMSGAPCAVPVASLNLHLVAWQLLGLCYPASVWTKLVLTVALPKERLDLCHAISGWSGRRGCSAKRGKDW